MQPVSKAGDVVARGGALSERHMRRNREIKGRNSSLMSSLNSEFMICLLQMVQIIKENLLVAIVRVQG